MSDPYEARKDWTAEQAIDHELTCACIGTLESFESPAVALHQLLCWERSTSVYFAQSNMDRLQDENQRLREWQRQAVELLESVWAYGGEWPDRRDELLRQARENSDA